MDGTTGSTGRRSGPSGHLRAWRAIAPLAVVVGLVVMAGATGGPSRADHFEKAVGPSEPVRDFPTDFLPLLPVDAQATSTLRTWADPRVGGFGGATAGQPACPADHQARIPVVLIHGNSSDAEFWRTADSGDGTIVDVRRSFLSAGWCAGEVWALSYTGGTGYTTANEVNVGDVAGFLRAVMGHTGSERVQVVAHSLGVTLVRRTLQVNPDLLAATEAFVAVAGANRGTTSCRGSGTLHVSHVCEETEPGSAWLDRLNRDGDTPGATRYLTVSDGSGLVDTFYMGPDARSPWLDGACNHEMPGTAHNTLARGAVPVARYQAFLADGTLPTCA